MSHIALYGGSFDPVHAGHGIVITEILNARCRTPISESAPLVDELWVVPCGHRKDKDLVAMDRDRIAMLQIFLEAYFSPQERVRIMLTEIVTGNAMLTIDLYRKMRAAYPEHCFSVVIGTDNAIDILQGRWVGSEDLMREVSFIVGPRRGFEIPKSEIPKNFEMLDEAVIATSTISATLIRRYIKEGKCLSSILPLAIINYIRRNRLYGYSEPRRD